MEEKDLFQKGFNDGYQMARFEPEFLKDVLKKMTTLQEEYIDGLENGKKQHEKELIQQQMREAQQSQSKTKGRSH